MNREYYYKNPVWVNVELKRLNLGEIDDRYLLNILEFLVGGGGYIIYLSKEVIKVLFEEAEYRGLEHKNSLKDALKAYERKNTVTNRVRCTLAVRKIEAIRGLKSNG